MQLYRFIWILVLLIGGGCRDDKAIERKAIKRRPIEDKAAFRVFAENRDKQYSAHRARLLEVLPLTQMEAKLLMYESFEERRRRYELFTAYLADQPPPTLGLRFTSQRKLTDIQAFDLMKPTIPFEEVDFKFISGVSRDIVGAYDDFEIVEVATTVGYIVLVRYSWDTKNSSGKVVTDLLRSDNASP